MTETASNYAPAGSSCASSCGSRSRSHSNLDINSACLEQVTMWGKNDVFFQGTGDFNGDLPSLSSSDIPDVYIEGCDGPTDRAMPLLPDA